MRRSASAALRALGVAALTAGCSVFATRPAQEMADAQAAIRAAKEVQADTLAPEHFRNASETYAQAQTEYRLKNHLKARDLAVKARRFAEQAEEKALESGALREDISAPEPEVSLQPPEPSSQTDEAQSVYYEDLKEQENLSAPPAQDPSAPGAVVGGGGKR